MGFVFMAAKSERKMGFVMAVFAHNSTEEMDVLGVLRASAQQTRTSRALALLLAIAAGMTLLTFSRAFSQHLLDRTCNVSSLTFIDFLKLVDDSVCGVLPQCHRMKSPLDDFEIVRRKPLPHFWAQSRFVVLRQ